MPNKKLINYIQEQLKRGYDKATIRSYLLKYGYNPSDVEEAIRQSYNPEIRHVIHFSTATLISITAIFLGLIIVSFIFFNYTTKAPETLLDLNLQSVKTTVNSGESITFISELDNLGSVKRYDANLRYELIDLKTSQTITFKEETRAVETKSSKQIEIQIPVEAAKGDYVLRAIANYNGQKAVATLPIKISGIVRETEEQKPSEQESTEQKPINKTQEKEITEKPKETKQGQEKTATEQETAAKNEAAGSEALTTFETLEKVGRIAPQNKKQAEDLCRKLELQTSKDFCFNKIAEVLTDRSYCILIVDELKRDVCLSNTAKISGKSEICQEISKESRKDSCYMNFVIDKKDYTVCDKVVNQYLRQSCESLRQLSSLNITNTAFYESLINQSLQLT